MRQHAPRPGRTVSAIGALGLAGCSLIYNPSNIPQGANDGSGSAIDAKPIDAHPDAEIIKDADPSMLVLSSIQPAMVLEGTGDGGGRPEVLVISGHQMVQGATVTVVSAGSDDANITVVDALATVADDGNTLAVRVIAHVDGTLAAGATRMLTVTVSQPDGGSGGSNTVKTIAWTEAGLGELTGSAGGAAPTLSGLNVFSSVNITAGGVKTAGTGPVIVQSTSSINIANAIDLSASAATPGTGGGTGGVAGKAGTGPGAGGGSTSGGGGGAGFGTAGTTGPGGGGAAGAVIGDGLVSAGYGSNQSSGGGGGGAVGGGGGGTIELTAAGSLTVAAVSSNGAGGTAGGLLGAGGGGGTGGLIVLRAATLALNGAVSANFGPAGGAGNLGEPAGGPGGAGRIRIDVPGAPTTGAFPASAHHGLSFDPSTASVYTTSNPTMIVHGNAGDTFQLHVLDGTGAPIGGTNVYDFDFQQASSLMMTPVLPVAGAYRLCLTPTKGNTTQDETTNCVHLAFVPSSAGG